jgi:Flp pilus assembly protein TadG
MAALSFIRNVVENRSMNLSILDRSSSPLKQRRGQAVVELTFGFLIFFGLFMAIVEFSHLLYTKVTLQHALRTAGRYMITGKTQQNSNGNNLPRDQVIHDVFCANVIATGLQCPTLASGNFRFVCLPTPGTLCSEPGGGPTQTVLVTVNLKKPAMMPFFSQFFPSGGVSFQLSTTWMNEPFSPAG